MPKLKMWMPPFDVIKYKKEYLTLKQELKDEIKQLQNQLHK